MPQFSQQVNFDTLAYNGTAGSVTADYSAVQTDTELIAAPGASKAIYLTDIIISAGAAGTVKIVRNTASAADVISPLTLAANGGAVINLQTPIKITDNQNVGITTTTTDDLSITLSYFVK